jgi:hypothetical protein
VHCRRNILFCISGLDLDIHWILAMLLTTRVLRASVNIVFGATVLDA